MWDPRLYALACCLGLLARWSYRAALRQLDGELAGVAGLFLFWIPLAGAVVIIGSFVVPAVRRRAARRRGR